ncbi:transcription termination/antitermination protein NusG [Adhaeretor mobilis]|uniref:transcription termination/antitermination protein NusG n=1 Tax=Adhaeretor mobilis TaxID=1930276 RepID=UPI001FE39651|nr:transcription termination/antitermination protein NusG [Adhaeretor mobilis]
MSEELEKPVEEESAEAPASTAVEDTAPTPVEDAASEEASTVSEVESSAPGDEAEVDEIEAEEEPSAEEAEEDEAAEEEEEAGGEAEEEAVEEEEVDPDAIRMDWYILKVQSNREKSISEALRRKIAIEGLEEFFGEVVVPTEKITEFKGGKKKVVQRKLYPGYIVVHMHINDDTWFAVRETSGIGDFTGSGGKPTPMLASEVARIIHPEEEETDEAPKLDIKFKLEEAVKVKEGTFEGFEGNVSEIDDQSGKVIVMINIFGRSTPVELEYWQIEST